MPANRSRTERWRDCLRQIHERQGALEITVAPPGDPPAPAGEAPTCSGSLMWRVRLLSLTDSEIVVEKPTAMGRSVDLSPGVRVLALMSIGQNHWMFHTTVLEPASHGGRPPSSFRLAMPDTVERCQRRNFYRISTAEISLPQAECWALINPLSVVAAEAANRAQIAHRSGNAAERDQQDASCEPLVLPEVGPPFKARVVNIGGGGVGLMIDKADAQAVDRARMYWMRIDLRPHIPVPIAVTARLAHTHMDSAQNVYAGLAFDFGFNPGHKDFVVEQILRCIASVERHQRDGVRKSA